MPPNSGLHPLKCKLEKVTQVWTRSQSYQKSDQHMTGQECWQEFFSLWICPCPCNKWESGKEMQDETGHLFTLGSLSSGELGSMGFESFALSPT